MKPEPELMDEAWKLYFYVLKGTLSAIVWTLHLAVMVMLRVAQDLNRGVLNVRWYIERWQPVRPIVFEFDRTHNETENA